MRTALRLVACLAAATVAVPGGAIAAPAEDWSARIGRDGLAATEAALAALPAPSPDDLFARGGVRFLRAVERALQTRWRHGATAGLAPVPVLRLELPANPSPEDWTPDLVTGIFRDVAADMEAARGDLAAIPDDATIGLTVRLSDLWLDIDGNGRRGEGEALLPLVTGAFIDPWQMEEGMPAAPPAIRFDTADAAWLSAYAHLVGAVADLVVAFDPTGPTERVFAANRDRTDRFGHLYPSYYDVWGQRPAIDRIAIIVMALRQKPDPALTRSARAHLLAMVEQNLRFWRLVAAETDNDAEWIPNARQTSALGLRMAPDTGAAWTGVLGEIRALLEGRRVISHPGLPVGAGIDLAAWLEDPAPVDVLGWIHGIDALPYARIAPPLSSDAWLRFENMVEGQGLMYALILN
ncbi:MAG: hypothetical protein N2422_12100 [Rhodobacteraceae bacterium]|nr:hypothetical protein [Paracoccaceae bacterium]